MKSTHADFRDRLSNGSHHKPDPKETFNTQHRMGSACSLSSTKTLLVFHKYQLSSLAPDWELCPVTNCTLIPSASGMIHSLRRGRRVNTGKIFLKGKQGKERWVMWAEEARQWGTLERERQERMWAFNFNALFIQIRCHQHLCLVTIVLDQRKTFQSVTPILKEPTDKRPMVTTPFSVQVYRTLETKGHTLNKRTTASLLGEYSYLHSLKYSPCSHVFMSLPFNALLPLNTISSAPCKLQIQIRRGWVT